MAIVNVGLTYQNSEEYAAPPSGKCKLRLIAKITKSTQLPAGAAPVSVPNPYLTCESVICFRLSGGFKVELIASLEKPAEKQISTRNEVELVAPVSDTMGFVRLDRKPFVENKIKASFTAGMLTGLSATDLSQIVGILAVPSALLKAVTVLVRL